MTQLDCYALMGSLGEKYITSTKDFKVAPNPKSVHLSSDKKGSRAISTGGWLWGVGHQSSNPKLALELIEHITAYENQVGETQRFGMIPVKKQILGKSKIQFKESWKNNVFKTSFKQIKLNKNTSLPYSKDFNSLAKKYVAIWKEVVTKSSGKALTEGEIQSIQKKHN